MRQNPGFIIIILVAVIGIAACNGAKSPEEIQGVRTDLNLTPVKIGGAPAFELIFPTLVGMCRGYFEQQGIKVEEFIHGPGSDIRTALLGGQLDAALLAFIHVPLARWKNQKVKIVASIYDKEIFSVVAREPLKNEVKTLKDLRGKRIGISKPGSGSWALISFYLSRVGLNRNKDVKLISVGNNLQTVYNALKTGLIDAYPSFEPQTTILTRNNIAYPLVSIWEKDVHQRFIGKSAMSMVLAASEKTINKNPLLVQKLVNVHKLSVIYISLNDARRLAGLILNNPDTASKVGNIDLQTLTSVIEKIKDGFSSGALSRTGYNNEMNLYITAGVLKKEIPFDESVDWRFAGLSDE